MEQCKDPFHGKDSISSQVYDRCPSCKQEAEQIGEIVQRLTDNNESLKDQLEWSLRNEEKYKKHITKQNEIITVFRASFEILARYHGGDGTITRDMVLEALGNVAELEKEEG